MFSAESGASKLALVALGQLLHGMGFPLLDTQVANPHTLSLGAFEMPRATYLQQVAQLGALPGRPGAWAELTPQLIQPCTAPEA
jgi:leucyl/phenylalanyl-tRNA--protein transferase